jgi:hypothetical protein
MAEADGLSEHGAVGWKKRGALAVALILSPFSACT